MSESEQIRQAAQHLRDASPDAGWALNLIAHWLDEDADQHDAGELSDDDLGMALDFADAFAPNSPTTAAGEHGEDK